VLSSVPGLNKHTKRRLLLCQAFRPLLAKPFFSGLRRNGRAWSSRCLRVEQYVQCSIFMSVRLSFKSISLFCVVVNHALPNRDVTSVGLGEIPLRAAAPGSFDSAFIELMSAPTHFNTHPTLSHCYRHPSDCVRAAMRVLLLRNS
jgi:hypothetical protein